MKKCLNAVLLCTAGLPFAAMAEPTFYGKLNTSLQYETIEDDTHTSVVNNASRVGIKGKEEVNSGLNVVYQAEYEISSDGDGDTFKKRNIFVGLEGDFGQVIAGNFDTPFKKAQGKIDLFSDFVGDIKNVITINDNRKADSFQYTTPSFSGVKVAVAHISSETEFADDGVSASIVYSNDTLYLAAAADQNVEGQDEDAFRVAAAYKVGPVTLGGLYEEHEEQGLESVSGWFGSVKYKVNDTWVLKAQAGESDLIGFEGETVSVGADYVFTKAFKVYGFYTAQDSTDGGVEEADYLAVGAEFKF